MMPTVEEICVKEVVTIDINQTFEEAIKAMADANIRNIIVTSSTNKYQILTTNDIIEFRLQNISMDIQLSQINLQPVKQIDSNINIIELLNHIDRQYEYMLVVSENKLVGILSKTDMINNIDPKILVEKQTIGNLMLQYSIVSLYEDATTLQATKLMNEKDIDSVIIVDKENQPKGIFTIKDFLNLLHLDNNLNKPIKTFMSTPIQTISSDTTIYDALNFIREKHFKRLVVTHSDGTIKGVITQSELLRLVNNKWMELIKEKGDELSKVNQDLLAKTEELEHQASIDFLTQLYNRGKFDAMVNYEIYQVKRYKNRNLSLVLLDIDDFKFINDHYGHDIGDAILQEIARIISLSIRQSDVAARWGGEEFILSLPETNIEQAILVAQKIRSTIDNHKFIQNLHITCSLGISMFHDSDSYESFFKRADTALYRAKFNGKNRVEIEDLSSIYE